MTRYFELFTQDFSKTLLTTTDEAAVEQFVRDSGQRWLPLCIEWGQRTWRERWAGRIELRDDGATSMRGESKYLNYMTSPAEHCLTILRSLDGLPVEQRQDRDRDPNDCQ